MFELWFDQNRGRVHVAHRFGFLWCGFDLFVFVLCLVSNVACVSCVQCCLCILCSLPVFNSCCSFCRIICLFDSSLPPVICRRSYVVFILFVFAYVQWCPTFCLSICLYVLSSACVILILLLLYLCTIVIHWLYENKDI
jgi:hypothetical protein